MDSSAQFFSYLCFKWDLIVWVLPKDLEVHSIFADLGLERFVRGKMYWEGDHLRLLLTGKIARGVLRC